MESAKSDLAEKATELEVAAIVVAESHIELYAFNWAHQIAACILDETRNLAEFWNGNEGRFSAAQTARYRDYQDFLAEQTRASSPIREFCILHGKDIKLLANIWWDRALSRVASETGLDVTDARKIAESYSGIYVPNTTVAKYTDEILADMAPSVGDWPTAITEHAVDSLWYDRPTE